MFSLDALQLNKLSIWQYFALIFILGIATRIALVAGSKSYLNPGRTETVRVEESLAEHGSFANPFCGGDGAHRARTARLTISVKFTLQSHWHRQCRRNWQADSHECNCCVGIRSAATHRGSVQYVRPCWCFCGPCWSLLLNPQMARNQWWT
jgi:hypothetical protein